LAAYLIGWTAELGYVIVDVTDPDQERHCSGFGLLGHRFLGRDGAICAPQFLIVQCQMALDPDAENCFVDHHARADVKQVVRAVDRQVESPVLPLENITHGKPRHYIFIPSITFHRH